MADREKILAMAKKRKQDAELLAAMNHSLLDVSGVDHSMTSFKADKELSALRGVAEKGEEYIQSYQFQSHVADKITINGTWQREKIIGSRTDDLHVALKQRDLEKLRGTLNEFEVSLFGSVVYPMHTLFRPSLKEVVTARREGTVVGGPQLERCLAWLSRASHTPISSLVPRGEVFPSAERYLEDRLRQPSLPTMPVDGEMKLLLVDQTCRTLELLSCVDLRLLSPSAISILLFALCKLSTDRLADATVHTRVIGVIRNIFDGSTEAEVLKKKREIICEFSHVFPDLSEDLNAIRLCIELFRLSSADPSSCLVLTCAVFIHRTEHGELEPSDVLEMSEKKFIKSYANIVGEVLPDVFDFYETDKNAELCVIPLVDACLTPHVIRMGGEKYVGRIFSVLDTKKRELIRSGRPDEAIIDYLLRSMMHRVEIEQSDQKYRLEMRETSDSQGTGSQGGVLSQMSM